MLVGGVNVMISSLMGQFLNCSYAGAYFVTLFWIGGLLAGNWFINIRQLSAIAKVKLLLQTNASLNLNTFVFVLGVFSYLVLMNSPLSTVTMPVLTTCSSSQMMAPNLWISNRTTLWGPSLGHCENYSHITNIPGIINASDKIAQTCCLLLRQ